MPRVARRPSRPGAAPGRGRPRARTGRHGATAIPIPPPEPSAPEPAAPLSRWRRKLQANLTARALALVVVLSVLTISYATSLRIYFSQAHAIADTKAEITTRQARITDLQGELGRWNDPAFVKTQARERLGWVVPGETGFTVLGADGKPLGDGVSLGAENLAPRKPRGVWWDRLWGSVQTADQPAPARPANAAGASTPITTKTRTR